MIEIDEFFLKTLDDLEIKITAYPLNKYDIIKTSGLLRQLILDGAISLFNQVNKHYKVKIKFNVAISLVHLLPMLSDVELYIVDPHPKDGDKYEEVVLDKFLDYTVVVTKGHHLSVYDFIMATANIFGGVHKGEPQTAKEQALNKIGKDLIINHRESIYQIIISISLIVLNALDDLKIKIIESSDGIEP